MVFKKEDCYEKTVWCGNGTKPKKGRNHKTYIRNGTRYECLKQGIGAGIYSEKRKNLPAGSLQHISYIGETHEKAFKRRGVRNIAQLITTLRSMTAVEKREFLIRVLKKSNETYDGRAYNSILLYIHFQGVKRLPECKKLNE